MFDKYRTRRELRRILILLSQEKEVVKIKEIKRRIIYCESLKYKDYELLFK